jgi:hypothetical protein
MGLKTKDKRIEKVKFWLYPLIFFQKKNVKKIINLAICVLNTEL